MYRAAGIRVPRGEVGPACYFHSALVDLGEGVYINHGCHIENVAMVEIGSYTALATHVTLITSDHEIGASTRRCGRWKARGLRIGKGCWLGSRVLVLPGVTIGDGCVVAAGAVVSGDCAPNGLYAGVPAHRVRDLPTV
jgi:maltose O-acetyltransferase